MKVNSIHLIEHQPLFEIEIVVPFETDVLVIDDFLLSIARKIAYQSTFSSFRNYLKNLLGLTRRLLMILSLQNNRSIVDQMPLSYLNCRS